MAIQLREPFFLRGRRSVPLRAIWMSLALGVIGGGAGLAAVLCYVLLALTLENSNKGVVQIIAGSTAISLATVVGVPYFRWRGDTACGIATKACCIMLIAAGPMVLEVKLLRVLLDLATQQMNAWTNMGAEELLMAVRIMFGLTLLWLAWSAACFRRSSSWLLTFLASGLSIPFWILSVAASLYSLNFASSWLPDEVTMFLAIVTQLSIPGQFFALLVIPWGVPFWWPPETEIPPQVELP